MLDDLNHRGVPGGHGDSSPPPPARRRAWGASRVTLGFFWFVIVCAGICFGIKIHEFLSDLLDEGGIGFAGSHLLNYMLVALGFFLLLVFALLSGHFASVEEVKYDMLEKEVARDVIAFGK